MVKDVVFGLARKYDDGVQTSVAMNKNGDVVEVHKSQSWGTLWYHTGKTNQMDINWSSSHKYDDGKTPSVALNDRGLIVEVHQSQSWETLWYHVGDLNKNTIFWGSHRYDSGITPSIALDNNNWCVEVHQSQSNSGLWYHVGQVNSNHKTIDWGSSHKYGHGTTPQVAMNNKGIVVEVHKSQTFSTLWYRVGILNTNEKTIDWGANHQYDDGVQPTIAITDDGFVIELHKNQSYGTLWRHIGTVNVDKKTINFSADARFDDGQAPSVACAFDGSMAIQTHQSQAHLSLWYSSSLILDRTRWMELMYNSLQSKQLWQITLPGSHDAGAFKMNTTRTPCGTAPSGIPATIIRSYATAHEMDIAGQLQNGCRYFDLRPYLDQGTFYAYHDVEGGTFDKIMSDVALFMQTTSRELVILKVSHFCKFNDHQHQQLIDLIKSKLDNYLFKDTSANLLTTSIAQFVGQGSRVFIWYDDAYISQHPCGGFWRNLSLYDNYSNTDKYDQMESNQLQKMKNHSGTSNQLFLLSWTLTFQDFGSVFKGGSLQSIAKAANRNLGEFLAKNVSGYQINVLYVDFLADARVTDCAIKLNG